jgi:hypothetical protein
MLKIEPKNQREAGNTEKAYLFDISTSKHNVTQNDA